MPIFYPDILEQRTVPRTFSYDEKDVILYALSLGMGADPIDSSELPFVYEHGLKVVPTAVTVLANRGSTTAPPVLPEGCRRSQLNTALVVHGDQRVELHRPLPPQGTFNASGRVAAAYDKGREKGAIIVYRTDWTDEDGRPVATLTSSRFARGDGGFGGPSGGGPPPNTIPDRTPDASVAITTRPDQALLYRLNGDRSPLHVESDLARRAGFPRPILHGLCTYGITCRALLQTIAGFDPDRIMVHQARFSAPVFPGETITTDLWQEGDTVYFRARVEARNVLIINNGLAVLRQNQRGA